MPEPGDDLAIGLSETTLDLAGHHLVTSGGMCSDAQRASVPLTTRRCAMHGSVEVCDTIRGVVSVADPL